jgi:hypothetical protein
MTNYNLRRRKKYRRAIQIERKKKEFKALEVMNNRSAEREAKTEKRNTNNRSVVFHDTKRFALGSQQ